MFDRRSLHAICILLVTFGLFWPAGAMANFTDPTRPPMAPAGESHQLSPATIHHRWALSSTVISANRRAAVINGSAVTVGQDIDGARLVKVLPHAAILRRGSRKFTIRLSPGGVKVPARAAGEEKRMK